MKALAFALIVLAFSACHRREQEPVFNEEEAREHMINANRILVEQEAAAIREFIVRHGWNMKETGTGLHMELTHPGDGPVPGQKDTVSIAFRLFLLDGALCYEADSQHPLTFVLGTGSQPHGLEEGLQLMPRGSRARLVLPAHLAYGPGGDGQKIPGNSALYYDLTMLNTERQKR